MTPAEAAALLDRASFRYARTMPETPHDYTLRDQWPADQFDAVVGVIERDGYSYQFRGRSYRQLNANGYCYWPMPGIGDPKGGMALINRRALGAVALYDEIADSYDDLYDSPRCHAEEAQVKQILGQPTGRVLDVGCGTGLLLDMYPELEGNGYLGIDPSPRMIERMRDKHPGAAAVCSKLADYRPRGRFDHVIALFGVPSYLTPSELFRIPHLADQWAIMLYKAEYDPKDGSDEFVIRHEQVPVCDHVDQVTNYWLLRGGGW